MLEPERVHRDAVGDLPDALTAPLLPHPPSLAEPSSPASVGSPEITDEEIDAASAACCRICLESDSEPGDELISPCKCKGTQQFVHRSCLDHWRSVKEGTAFSHCTTCKARFHLRVECLEDDICRRMKFRLFVARDVIIIFLLMQAVATAGMYFDVCTSLLFQTIAAIGGMAYFLDKDGNFRNKFSDDWERFLSKHPVPFYYSVGVVAFFVLVGFVGLILHLSSYNNADPCLVGSRDCCFGWGLVDLPASMEACFAFAVIFVILLAILGVAYGFFAASVAIQRIWQRHYHILTKKELTREYVVVDLPGGYTPPKMDPEQEQRLKLLQLM